MHQDTKDERMGKWKSSDILNKIKECNILKS